jgi:hypothetical protein
MTTRFDLVSSLSRSVHAIRLLSSGARDARLVHTTATRIRSLLDDTLTPATGLPALDAALDPHSAELTALLASLTSIAKAKEASPPPALALDASMSAAAFRADVARMLAAVATPAFVEAARDLTKKTVALLDLLAKASSAVPAELAAQLRESLKLAVTCARSGVLSPDTKHAAAQLCAALDAVLDAVHANASTAAVTAATAVAASDASATVASDAELLAVLARVESALTAAATELAPLSVALDDLDAIDATASVESLAAADIAITVRGVSAALGKLRQFATRTPRQLEQLVRVTCKAMALLHSQLHARPADARAVATRRAAIAAAATTFASDARNANSAQALVVEINCCDAMLRDMLRAMVDEKQGGAPLTPRGALASPRSSPLTPPATPTTTTTKPVPPADTAPVSMPTTPQRDAQPSARVVTPSRTATASPDVGAARTNDSIGWSSVRPGRTPTTTRSRRSRSMDAATAAAAIDVACNAIAASARGRFLSTATATAVARPLVPPCDYETGRMLNLDTEMLLGSDGEVKGGTLPALVSRLYSDESNAPYVAVFMHTFRAFVDSERLLRILQASYGALVPTPDDSEPVRLEKKRYRLRVGNAIKKLVEEVHDDGTNKALADDLVTQFLDRVMFPVDETLALTIKLKFHQRRSCVESPTSVQQQFSEPAPKPLLPRTGTRASFLTVDALELARQMSLIDAELLRRIGPFELLGGAWAKENKETNSANLLAMIASFNARSTLVVASIVAETQLKQRAALLRKMIAVASECRALNNFHATFALVAGLNSAPVHRLQKTWAQLSDRERAAFAALGELVSSAKSFKQYRETLHTVNPPCVPYIGVYQTDLIFIDQGNPDTLNDGRLINFDKCRRTAAVIRELVMYQLPYNMVPVASIQNFLTTPAETGDDKALFAASLEIEPRQ